MQLPLLPLPVGILSEWVPIADAKYVRPAHSGEYDLMDCWAIPARVRYCADSDTWACKGGDAIWDYAIEYRGCTVPFVEAPTVLRACEFCGHGFDQERLGKYGCPNCEGNPL